jgi:hypothetical protein
MNTDTHHPHDPAPSHGEGRPPDPGHSQGTTIVLNLEEVVVHSRHLNYAQLVKLAFPDDPPAETSDIVYTITISSPSLGEISLARGDKPVPVEEGMVCHVRTTGRS